MPPNPRNQQVIAEFRARGGTVAALSDGPPLLLLTSTGAVSGQPRLVPLRYLRDGDRWVIFAGNAGQPGSPDWSRNLAAHPHATIEVGTETIAVTTVSLTGTEREQCITRHAAAWPWWATTVLAHKIPSQLPVIALVRREPPG